jgi:hypothetical protein
MPQHSGGGCQGIRLGRRVEWHSTLLLATRALREQMHWVSKWVHHHHFHRRSLAAAHSDLLARGSRRPLHPWLVRPAASVGTRCHLGNASTERPSRRPFRSRTDAVPLAAQASPAAQRAYGTSDQHAMSTTSAMAHVDRPREPATRRSTRGCRASATALFSPPSYSQPATPKQTCSTLPLRPLVEARTRAPRIPSASGGHVVRDSRGGTWHLPCAPAANGVCPMAGRQG